MSHTETCPTCLRRERVDGDQRVVEQPGGARAPAEHPTLAAWRLLLDHRHGRRGAVVGPCPACGMPMFTDADHPSVPWTLETPDGPVVVDDGDLDEAGLTARLEQAWTEPVDWAGGVLSGVASLSVVIPILLWIFAIIVVSGIFYEAFKVNFLGQAVTPFE